MIPAESSAERRAPTTPFSEANVASALDEAVIGHLCRIGAFDAADALSEEACLPGVSSPELVAQLRALHAILDDLRGGWSARAFEWLGDALLDDDNLRDELEFELRKEDFVRILLAEHDCATSGTCPRCSAQVQAALAYGGQYLRSLASPARLLAVKSLFASVLYLPRKRLRHSPYAGLYAPYLADHAPPLNPHVESMLTAAFLKTLRLPQRSPLSIVADIGGSGSVAKIQKVRNVMKAKRTEWSAVGELPVSSLFFPWVESRGLTSQELQIHIPVPVSHRYHSIFACPVSKEQATATNPPMLLPCGHAIARESLHRLGKGGSCVTQLCSDVIAAALTPAFHRSVKCPYCPVVSQITAAIPLHF